MSEASATATVYDITPAQFRRMVKAEEVGPLPATSILDDCADGILALDFALTFAGFPYQARQLTLSIVGLLGGVGARLEAYDAELAAHVKCSDRTVRRWRKEHMRYARAKQFSLLKVEEGEYDASCERYGKTAYTFTAGEYVNVVVAEARASDLYRKDRRAAIERAAEEHYADIPDAPPRQRNRRPRRAPAVLVERAFGNAARHVESGRKALAALDPDSLSALLESGQGTALRETLLKLQADIAEVLENFPQATDGEDVDGGIGQNVRYPPVEDLRVSESSAEDTSSWDRAFSGLAEPRVRSVELVLRPPPPEESPPGDSSAVEELEAEAIRAEACGQI